MAFQEVFPGSSGPTVKPLTTPERLRYLEEHKWEPARREFYSQSRERTVTTWRFADVGITDPEVEDETINEMHGVDFLNDVIPGLISRKAAEGGDKKVRILDMGCGVGFFSDQIRARFGDRVEVYGTSIANKPGEAHDREAAKKKAIVEEIRNGTVALPDDIRAGLLTEIREDMHPNDAKLISILEMDDTPEFDLIIDTAGEMFYAGRGFFPYQSYSDEIFDAAIKKLKPGGRFYIGRLQQRDEGKFLNSSERERLGQVYGVSINSNHQGNFGPAFVITKPE